MTIKTSSHSRHLKFDKLNTKKGKKMNNNKCREGAVHKQTDDYISNAAQRNRICIFCSHIIKKTTTHPGTTFIDA